MYSDPYRPTNAVYECYDCSNRQPAADYDGRCPNCGGRMKNISVARE